MRSGKLIGEDAEIPQFQSKKIDDFPPPAPWLDWDGRPFPDLLPSVDQLQLGGLDLHNLPSPGDIDVLRNVEASVELKRKAYLDLLL